MSDPVIIQIIVSIAAFCTSIVSGVVAVLTFKRVNKTNTKLDAAALHNRALTVALAENEDLKRQLVGLGDLRHHPGGFGEIRRADRTNG